MTRPGREEKGATTVEFAVVGVVLFFLIFGIIDFARVMQSWITVQHAAREAGRFAITGKNTCAGAANRTDCIKWTAKKATTSLVGGGPSALDTVVVVGYQAWDYQNGSWSGPTSNKTGKQCDQLEVTVTYRHNLMNPMLVALVPSGINMVGRQRMTNEPWGICAVNDGVG